VQGESCSRSHENVRTWREHSIISNMMMNSKKLRICRFFRCFSPLLLHLHRRSFELSFVSFNTRNKIWRKIITEIKALIFSFRVLFFCSGGGAKIVVTSSSVLVVVLVREKSLRMLSDANLISTVCLCVFGLNGETAERKEKKLNFYDQQFAFLSTHPKRRMESFVFYHCRGKTGGGEKEKIVKVGWTSHRLILK
jgi:hypothetical protein